MGYTITVATNNTEQSKALCNIFIDFFNNINEKELNMVKLISSNVSDHLYLPDVRYGACISFTVLSTESFKFLSNVSRYATETFGTFYYYDGEVECSTEEISWIIKSTFLPEFMQNFFCIKLKSFEKYFNEVVVPKVEEVK